LTTRCRCFACRTERAVPYALGLVLALLLGMAVDGLAGMTR
jgi:hypothetical protein